MTNSFTPTSADLRRVIERSGISQAKAAELAHTSTRRIERMLAGSSPVCPAIFELLEIKTGQKSVDVPS